MILLAAALMAVAAYGIESVLVAWGLPANTLLSLVVVAPLIEEALRYAIAKRWLWQLSFSGAVLFGLIVGTLEVVAKMIDSGAHVGPDVRTLLNLAGFYGSIPIHVSLSVAFYALQRRRLPILIGLHMALNLTLIVGLSLLWDRVGVPAFAAISVVAITALCFGIGYAARRLASEGDSHVRQHLWR